MELCESQFSLEAAGPIRLMVVDDHAVIRRGIAAILAGTQISIVGEAETAAKAIEQAKILKPDVVLLDVQMPGMNGLEAIPSIREASPRSRLVIFTAYENPRYVFQAIAAGAAGCLLKGAMKDELITAIARAHVGLPPEPNSPTGRRIGIYFSRENLNEELPLTDPEAAVMRYVAQGRSNTEIGRSLDISADMVNMHVRKAMRKLDAGDRTQAAVAALKNGLI